jgi:hypothetical protein
MAKILDTRPVIRNWRVYEWDTWFDGQIWELQPGIDFPATTKLNSVRGAAYMAARRRGVSVSVGITENRKSVWVQANQAT